MHARYLQQSGHEPQHPSLQHVAEPQQSAQHAGQLAQQEAPQQEDVDLAAGAAAPKPAQAVTNRTSVLSIWAFILTSFGKRPSRVRAVPRFV
jgi:hypothetical protein